MADLRPSSLWRRFTRRRQRQIMAERAWEDLVQHSESLARAPQPAPGFDEFERLVSEAIDRLPEEFQQVLDEVPIVVSDRGGEQSAYGWYEGDGASRGWYGDRIVIFRDTLERDFGHDRELLARQVEQTVRHEVAHHLGWDEPGVRNLGL
jgi:predicted Zn-dependent protease with MMP-like domain